MSNDKDTLRDEYPEELIRSGERGKYAKAYREGSNIVLIEPDLHKLFPTSDAVNRAHREYVATNGTAPKPRARADAPRHAALARGSAPTLCVIRGLSADMSQLRRGGANVYCQRRLDAAN
jgi:hypothetical protein